MNYNPVLLEQLMDAAGKVQLTEREAVILKWLASWDASMVACVVSVMHKARKAERRKAQHTRRHKAR